MNSYRWPRLLIVGLWALLPVPLWAATAASDSASDTAYDTGWLDGTGGGTGWGSPWTLTATTNDLAQAGFIIQSSTSNNAAPGGTDIDSSGRSWGMYANNSNQVSATRSFNSTLETGQTLRVDMDSSVITNLVGSEVGVELLNQTGEARFRCYATGTSANYLLDDGGGTAFDSGVPVTNTGVRITFQLSGADTYQVTLTTTNATQTFPARSLAGTTGSLIDRVRLFNHDAGFTVLADAYFNSLALDCAGVPTCDISLSLPACTARNTAFTAPPGLDAYAWSLTGVTGDAALVPPVTNRTVDVNNGTTAGSYTLVLSNVLGGCTNSCSTNITVNATPACDITVTPACDSSALCAPAALAGYSWTGPGIVGATNAQCITAVSNGTYSVTVQETDGCTSTCSTNIAIRTTSFCVNPVSVNFAPTAPGQTSDVVSVTLSNCSDSAVTISGVSLGGADSGSFVLGIQTCTGSPLAPGAACTVNVRFAPLSLGPKSANLVVTHNGCGNPTQVPLSGTAYQPTFRVSPSLLNFGDQLIAITSTPLTIVVENIGTQLLNIVSAQITGANSNDFRVSGNDCGGQPFAPGDACGIRVQFIPTVLGLRTGILVITANDGTPPQQVLLQGNGVVRTPQLTATPTSLVFAGQAVGTTSGVASVTLRNTGSASVVISNILLSAGHTNDFLIQPGACVGATLLSNETCEVGLRFKPSQTGLRAATLTVLSSAGAIAIDVTGTGVAPVLFVSPGSVLFGTQTVGAASAPQTLVVQNLGDALLTVGPLSFSGANTGDFAVVGNTCGGPIPPGGSCALQVSFTPAALGPRTAQLSIGGNATNAPVVVSLAGVGGPATPAIGFLPGSLDFGEVVVATTSAVQSVTVTNSGTAALLISAVQAVGGNTGDFVVTNTCTGSLVPVGGTCRIDVRLVPSATGARASTVRVLSNVGTNSFAVTGVGIAPAVALLPAVLNFGTQLVSVASAPLVVTLQNVGDSPLVISGLAIVGAQSNNFAVTGQTCLGTPLAPGESCSVNVTFTPSVLGPRGAALRVTSNATNTPPVDVTLQGVGASGVPALQFNPTSLSFGTTRLGQTSVVQSVTVNNAGTAALLISEVQAIGGDAGAFLTSGTCVGTPVPAGGSCRIDVRFAPTSSGLKASVVRILSNAGAGTNTIAVSGTGVAPTLQVLPVSLSFGTQLVNQTSAELAVAVANLGDGPLTVSSITLSGPNAAAFSISDNTCGILQAGDSCSLHVRFTPTLVGSNTATLVVAGTATNSPQTVALSGVGAALAPAIGTRPSSLTFTQQLVGTTSPTQSVLITNGGTANLVILGTQIDGGNAADFQIISAPCLQLTPGDNCEVRIAFRPTASGNRASSLMILSNVGTGTNLVSLVGQGIAPAFAALPVALDFGTNTVNTTSPAKSVVISNVGDSPLAITGVTIGGLSPGQFLLSSNACLNQSLAPGQSCRIDVAFRPTAAQPLTATLLIAGLATNTPLAVPLTGVGQPFQCPTITINPASLPAGTQGLAYATTTFTPTNGVAPYAFSVIVGSLPPGLGLNSAGVLSGAPTQAGTFPFTVQVRDANSCTASNSYSVTITCGTVTVSPSSLPNATAGFAYNQTLSASGATAPYTFAVTAGTLPGGFSLSSAGVLSGMSATLGTNAFTVTATSTNGCTGSRQYALVVAGPVITLLPTSLPGAVLLQPYSAANTASGGTAPYTFAVTAGALPPGITLAANGVYSGQATDQGVFAFTVTATDAHGFTGSRDYTIVAGCPQVTITPQTLAPVQLGAPIEPVFLSTYPTVQNVAWIRTVGELPTGLTLSTNGFITGTPTALGTFTFTVKAFITANCTRDQTYALTVGCPHVELSPANLPFGELYIPYDVTLSATNGTAPYTYAVTSGSLPQGISLTAAGRLSGIPLSASSAFTVTVTDANGCATDQKFVLTIAIPPPSILVGPPALAAATVGDSYQQTLSAAGATGTVLFSLAAGTAPAGLALSPAGQLTGVPTTPGDYDFVVLAADSQGHRGSRDYRLFVGCRQTTIEPALLVSPLVGTAYQQALHLSDGTAASFQVIGGALPAGLILSADGVIAGTPQAVGQASFTVKATSTAGCVVQRALSLNVVTVNSGGGTADLGVQVQLSPATAAAGADLTCVVTVTNGGPTVATGLTVVQNFSGAITVVSKPAGMMAQGNALIVSVPVLAAGEARSFTAVVRAAAAGTLTDAATVLGNEADPNSGNNTAAAAVDIAGEPPSVTVVRANQSLMLPDVDGDQVTVQLKGNGEVRITRNGAGAVVEIGVLGTDDRSSLTLKTKRAGAGNGVFDLSRLVGTGALGTLSLQNVRLVGDGLAMGGVVHNLNLWDVADGASVVIGGTAQGDCRIKLHVLGTGARIQSGSRITKLTAAQLRQSEIMAPSVSGVAVKGDKKLGLAATNEAVIVPSPAP